VTLPHQNLRPSRGSGRTHPSSTHEVCRAGRVLEGRAANLMEGLQIEPRVRAGIRS